MFTPSSIVISSPSPSPSAGSGILGSKGFDRCIMITFDLIWMTVARRLSARTVDTSMTSSRSDKVTAACADSPKRTLISSCSSSSSSIPDRIASEDDWPSRRNSANSALVSLIMATARRCRRCSLVRAAMGWKHNVASSPFGSLSLSDERIPTTGIRTSFPSRALSPGATSVSSVFRIMHPTAPAASTLRAFSTKEQVSPRSDPRRTSAILPRSCSAFLSSSSAQIGSALHTSAVTSSNIPNADLRKGILSIPQ
mmetsp:Transcript_1400/g.3062  ORF Transcript_1400/g.3062 Transcript_1400/m.3062 type:complete len:254 (+) Transcript_1400:239-1000(+)